MAVESMTRSRGLNRTCQPWLGTGAPRSTPTPALTSTWPRSTSTTHQLPRLPHVTTHHLPRLLHAAQLLLLHLTLPAVLCLPGLPPATPAVEWPTSQLCVEAASSGSGRGCLWMTSAILLSTTTATTRSAATSTTTTTNKQREGRPCRQQPPVFSKTLFL